MAKKNRDEEKLNYAAEVRLLKQQGPGRLYFLWGPEDYLREQYLTLLKSLCLPEMEDSFSYRRLNGPELDVKDLQQAVDAMPFLCEHSFVEVRDADLNKLASPDELLKVLEDVPDYCTVAFVQNTQFEPDGRLKFIKSLRALATELKFTQQSQGMLTDWIARRFSAAGKSVELEAAQRLMFISGDLMNRLIPEIEKAAAALGSFEMGHVIAMVEATEVCKNVGVETSLSNAFPVDVLSQVIFVLANSSVASQLSNATDVRQLQSGFTQEDALKAMEGMTDALQSTAEGISFLNALQRGNLQNSHEFELHDAASAGNVAFFNTTVVAGLSELMSAYADAAASIKAFETSDALQADACAQLNAMIEATTIGGRPRILD